MPNKLLGTLSVIYLASFCFVAQGATLYVSKLGDNSDGSSWRAAYTTIQAALDAVPDAGGHRIIIRPDTYMEAMLAPAQKGAQDAYNELIGDVDGRHGSGAKGWVIIDSSDPQKGFKSYDWYGTIRSNEQGWSKEHTDPTFSAIIWDRWKLSGLYVTGSDGGLFWDMTDHTEPFTVVVEDCVGIGRAFGGGVANGLSRPDEPTTFRRCKLYALDWWGDTAAAYVRVENESMPESADVVFEDCVMVSPQCALKGGNFGFTTFTRAKLNRCQLIALNFSQPQGTPIDGAIQSVENGKYFHVDLEDTTVMGYKVFGVRVDKESVGELGYSTRGDVQAYVQYQQDVPEGFYRLQQWPVDTFAAMAPPPAGKPDPYINHELIQRDLCEISAVHWQGRLCHMLAIRPAHGGTPDQYYLELRDAETNALLSRFAEGYGLASALVHDGVFYAFASRFEDNDWNDVTMFKSADLKSWEQKVVIEQEDEHLFNSSVCKGPDGFVMAYESNTKEYPAFTTKFARSDNLETWTKLPEATFGTNRYTACPNIHYADGYYYVLYLERRSPRHYYETYITRSTDLKHWMLSSANPVLWPAAIDDGINASDPDLIEHDGKTYVYYAVGDQQSWMNVKRAVYPAPVDAYLASWYQQPGVPDHGAVTKPAEDDVAQAQRRWFEEARFGIFIHWGLYAEHGRNTAGPYVSWAMEQEGIPVSEYEKYAEQFNPKKFEASAWMELFKEAGARYVTFTSKHHEGFAMFDSALTDYDAADRAAKRDFVRDLTEAARASGLRISFYYSTLDWRHPDFEADLAKYVDEYLFGQVRELCTNYGPIDGIWFDGEWDHPAATWRADELVPMIHALQPGAVVNDRLGKGERGKHPLADFYTREQPHEINDPLAHERTEVHPWEACMTIGESWGYKRGDDNLKSSSELIRYLVDVVSRGGNLLLNVGPTPEGEIPAPLAARLRDIGRWLDANGEAVYRSKAVPWLVVEGAKCTQKDNRLYLFVADSTATSLHIPIDNTLRRAWLVETGAHLELDDTAKRVALPATLPNPDVSVIAVELDGAPRPANAG